jgi:hypothetical protein
VASLWLFLNITWLFWLFSEANLAIFTYVNMATLFVKQIIITIFFFDTKKFFFLLFSLKNLSSIEKLVQFKYIFSQNKQERDKLKQGNESWKQYLDRMAEEKGLATYSRGLIGLATYSRGLIACHTLLVRIYL